MYPSPMPFDVHIDPEVNCVFFRSTGPHSIEDVSPAFDGVIVHPDYRRGMNLLRDMRTQQIPRGATFKSMSNLAKQVHRDIDQQSCCVRRQSFWPRV